MRLTSWVVNQAASAVSASPNADDDLQSYAVQPRHAQPNALVSRIPAAPNAGQHEPTAPP